MKVETLDQINRDATQTLYRELGVSKTIRFLRQYSLGEGDYTREKKQVFKEKTVDNIVRDMNKNSY